MASMNDDHDEEDNTTIRPIDVWRAETHGNKENAYLIVVGGKTDPKLKCANETCSFERAYDLPEETDAEEGLRVPPAAVASGS